MKGQGNEVWCALCPAPARTARESVSLSREQWQHVRARMFSRRSLGERTCIRVRAATFVPVTPPLVSTQLTLLCVHVPLRCLGCLRCLARCVRAGWFLRVQGKPGHARASAPEQRPNRVFPPGTISSVYAYCLHMYYVCTRTLAEAEAWKHHNLPGKRMRACPVFRI